MIGELRESSLHEALKTHYARELQGLTEQPVAGYIVDVLIPGEVIEIQTGSFSNIRKKIDKLLESHRVRLVYPIAREKIIRLYDGDGTRIVRERKSPLHGVPALAGKELMYIHEAVRHPQFSLELAMITLLEERIDDGGGSWRRKGVRILDRRLGTIVDTILLDEPASYRILLPSHLPGRFTNKELAASAGITSGQAAKLTWFLRKIGVLEEAGKRGRALEFQAAPNVYIGDGIDDYIDEGLNADRIKAKRTKANPDGNRDG